MTAELEMPTGFRNSAEADICESFLRDGYIIQSVENRELLHAIRAAIAEFAAGYLEMDAPEDIDGFLNTIHERVDVAALNGLRLAVIGGLRQLEWFRPAYYRLVERSLAALVGNELAMQRGVGLSVQLPDDTSSLLPIHADVWDGDSAFEVVVWLPLVNCFKTKSMYIVPMERDRELQREMAKFRHASAEDLFQEVAQDVKFLDVDFGSVLIFTQTLMHGNRVNRETETRWSMNCRFKSLFSPYADKRLGEFFEPITMRPATRIGSDYQIPGGFSE